MPAFTEKKEIDKNIAIQAQARTKKIYSRLMSIVVYNCDTVK